MSGTEHRFMPVRADSFNVSSSTKYGLQNATIRPVSPTSKSKIEAFWEIWDKFWIYELGSCLLSLVFFIAIIVVLKMFENRRLPDWPLGITINTVISILATALGSTLSVPISESLGQLKWLHFRSPQMITDIETFDAATRGPIGAMQMFYKLKGLHMGNIGSFITIIALALSPFIQQVIQYQPQSTVLSLNATIPMSNQFTLDGGGSHPDFQQIFVNSSTQAAVFNGIFNPDSSSSQVKANCVTGNCTFAEPYSTLAVCSSCSNITDFITKSIYDSFEEGNKTFNSYNYTLPNGLFIADHGELYISTVASAIGNDTVWQGFASPLSVITTLSSTNDAVNDPVNGDLIEGPWATQCVLYFCVNTYNGSVEQGTLSETLISTYSNESATPFGTESGPNGTSGYVLTQDPCLTSIEHGSNSTYIYDGEPQDICVYAVQPQSFIPLQIWLRSVFTSGTGNSENPEGSALQFQNVIYNNNQSNFTFVESVMARVALSLTTHVRTYGIGSPALGIATIQEIYIVVEWDWLILPGLIVFFSIFFMLITILQSRGMEPWKSSSLALLFASDVRAQQDDIGDLTGIGWIAEGRCAVLKRTAEGNITLTKDID